MRKQFSPVLSLVLMSSLVSGLQGAILFRADLRPEFVVPTNGATSPSGLSSASGVGIFELDLTPGAPKLTYEITFTGLDLMNDITGIHLHFGHAPMTRNPLNLFFDFSQDSPRPKHENATGPNGPHLLNIFGLPREDDADLVVDAANNRLSGVWDNSDGNFGTDNERDPGDSVPISAAISELLVEEVYVQVHTRDFPAPFTGELRGQLSVVPEPSTAILVPCGVLLLLRRKR